MYEQFPQFAIVIAVEIGGRRGTICRGSRKSFSLFAFVLDLFGGVRRNDCRTLMMHCGEVLVNERQDRSYIRWVYILATFLVFSPGLPCWCPLGWFAVRRRRNGRVSKNMMHEEAVLRAFLRSH